ADRNRSHWSTSKTPSYTKSVSWQHHLKDESGKEQFSGAVVKTREATPGKEIEAITRRMLDFSPRLKKLAGVPCQVYVRTVAANNAQPLTQDQCLRALHHLRVQSTSKTAPQAK
ncbi:YjeJ family protein, partial [Escherichia coli]|uniref:YjeJ family protein n=2 Tax=Escherichia coli TaxID=562 RepID=UPI0029168190